MGDGWDQRALFFFLVEEEGGGVSGGLRWDYCWGFAKVREDAGGETEYRGGDLVPIGEKLLVWRIERWMMLQRRQGMAVGFATYTGRGRRRTLGVR